MIKNRYPKLVGLLVISLSSCFAGTCTTGLRDAVLTGVFDFTSGTVTDTLTTLVPVSDFISGTATLP